MTTIGSVTELWRFPVKSMQGECLQEVMVTANGVLGDRAYALIDVETGKVVSAKSVRRFPDLLAYRASFVEPPRAGNDVPAVRIDLPNGTSVRSDAVDIDRVLSAQLRRDVRLARVAPDDFTIDIYHPDIEGASPDDLKGTVVAQKLGPALFAELGMASPLPAGAFLDAFPLSLITTSTLDRLNELRPESRFDPRRFRMNVVLDTEQPGFVENGWVGHVLKLGEAMQVSVALLDARCVMTTLAQGDLPQDNDILRTLVQHNQAPMGDFGALPCAGVYAVVTAPGTLRTGDRATLA